MVANAPAPTQKHPPTHCKLPDGKCPGRRRKRAKNAVQAMIFVRGRHYHMRKVQLNIKGVMRCSLQYVFQYYYGSPKGRFLKSKGESGHLAVNIFLKGTTLIKKCTLLVAVCAITACASNAPKQNWIVVKDTDPFTDKTTCTVTTGSFYAGDTVYTLNGNYYPYIQKDSSNIIVGVRSGGKLKIPVGNIQLRIDANPAWTITSAETTLLKTNANINAQPTAYTENFSDEQKKVFANTYEAAMNNATQAMSPFTSTTGDKAKTILAEMLRGQKLIYRTVGLNQAASSTGEVLLDNSLKASLSQCGIAL